MFLKGYNTFSIRSGGDNSLGGLIEVLKDAKSINEISKRYDNRLFDYFTNKYGDVNSKLFKIVQENFIQSMAAYSIVSYFL